MWMGTVVFVILHSNNIFKVLMILYHSNGLAKPKDSQVYNLWSKICGFVGGILKAIKNM